MGKTEVKHDGGEYSESSTTVEEARVVATRGAPQRGAAKSSTFEPEPSADVTVRWLRVLVGAVLLGAAATLGTVVYKNIEQDEVSDFENQFASYAHEMVEVSNENGRQVVGALRFLSTTATSLIVEETRKADPSSFYRPGFLTMPHAEQQLDTVRTVTGALLVAYLPLVQSSDYEAWIEYSSAHQDWILQSNEQTDMQDWDLEPVFPGIWNYPPKDRRHLASCEAETTHNRKLERSERIAEDPTSDGPFAPIWTFSPPPRVNNTHIVNLNLFYKSVFRKAAVYMEHTRTPVVLDVCAQNLWFGDSAVADYDHPQTVIVHPVFADFTKDAPIVGYVIAVVPWDRFFKHILAEDSEPVMAIVQVTCDKEILSFEVQGHEATFLSEDQDLHDTRYDYIEVTERLFDFASDPTLTQPDCIYTLSIYATSTMEATFHTNEALTYAMLVVAVVGFTSIVIMLYDFFMHRRQSHIQDKANRAGAIVSVRLCCGVEVLVPGAFEQKPHPMFYSLYKCSLYFPKTFNNACYRILKTAKRGHEKERLQ